MEWITNNWKALGELVAAIIGVASLIIKLIPALKKDSPLLPIVKFVAKFIALNKTVTDADRPQ